MLFTRPTACKEARVDSVSKPTLKHCADQLSSVFRDILNTSVVTCLLQQLNHAKQGKMSDFQTINTRFPEGHILCPLLYTNSCASNNHSVRLLKFADDTTLSCVFRSMYRGSAFTKTTSFWLGKTKDVHNLTCVCIVWSTIDGQIC